MQSQPRVKLDLPPGGFPEYLTVVNAFPPAAGSFCSSWFDAWTGAWVGA